MCVEAFIVLQFKIYLSVYWHAYFSENSIQARP